jgi:hypothetical protein
MLRLSSDFVPHSLSQIPCISSMLAGGSTADDSWVTGAMFSSKSHLYLELFQAEFGTDSICLPLDKSIRVLL